MKDLLNIKAVQDTTKAALNRYSWKPTAEKYKLLLPSLKFTIYILGVFSIMLAFTAMHDSINKIVNNSLIATIIALLILSILEGIKQHTGALVFRNIYKSTGEAILIKVAFVVLFSLSLAISVFFSYEGGQIANNRFNTSVSDQQQLNNTVIDSINNYYNNRLESINKEEQEYKSSVSYLGKIDIHNKANKSRFALFTAQKEAINQQMQEALHEAKNNNLQTLNSKEQQFTKTENIILYFSIVNELLIVVILLLIEFIYFQVYREAEVVSIYSDRVKMNSEYLKGYESGYFNTNQAITIAAKKEDNRIGFRAGEEEKEEPSLKSVYDFLEKYKEVVADFEAGRSYSDITASFYNVEGEAKQISKSTAQNIKRSINIAKVYSHE